MTPSQENIFPSEAQPLPNERGMPTLDQLDDFFIGDLEGQELRAMFQPMIDSGVVWHLPLKIIHAAVKLLRYGICEEAKK